MKFKDQIALATYGMSILEAHAKQICVSCKKPWELKTYSLRGVKEYKISGLCEACFDNITREVNQ